MIFTKNMFTKSNLMFGAFIYFIGMIFLILSAIKETKLSQTKCEIQCNCITKLKTIEMLNQNND